MPEPKSIVRPNTKGKESGVTMFMVMFMIMMVMFVIMMVVIVIVVIFVRMVGFNGTINPACFQLM